MARLEAERDQAQTQHQQTVQAVQTYVAQQQQQQAVPQQPPPAQMDYDTVVTEPEKFVTEWDQRRDAKLQQTLNQYAQPIVNSNTAMAKQVARQDPKHKEVWDRWGGEVENYMSGLPAEQQMNPDTWSRVAKIVKADHVDELLQEGAQRVQAEAASVVETGTQTVGDLPLSEREVTGFDKMAQSAYGQDLLERQGKRIIIDHCNQRGISVDQYADECARVNIRRNPDNKSEWKSTIGQDIHNRSIQKDV